MYLAHEIQQPIPKLWILNFHELFLRNLLFCFYLVCTKASDKSRLRKVRKVHKSELSSFDQIKTNIENYVHIFSHLTRFDWVFIKMKYIPTSNEKMGKLKMRRIHQNRGEEFYFFSQFAPYVYCVYFTFTII